MNERIRELLLEAREQTAEGKLRAPTDVWAQKFAELIILECVGRIKRVGILEDIENETDMVVNAVKEHFGVEE
jgi:hypothetical protein